MAPSNTRPLSRIAGHLSCANNRLSSHRSQEPSYTLSQLMHRYQSFKCKEPRDKIQPYGIDEEAVAY